MSIRAFLVISLKGKENAKETFTDILEKRAFIVVGSDPYRGNFLKCSWKNKWGIVKSKPKQKNSSNIVQSGISQRF